MIKYIIFIFICINVVAQIKPSVQCVGGDNVPIIKQQIQVTLETILLEMNRIKKGNGSIEALKTLFVGDAFEVFNKFAIGNGAYTARRIYNPLLIERNNRETYDVRSISVNVTMGETEGSNMQDLIFSFNKEGKVSSLRAVLPNYDYNSVISAGLNERDSVLRGIILDFMEQLRMAYNTKDMNFLEKVYSDNALIIVGTVIKEEPNSPDLLKTSYLSQSKIKLVQQSKREYLDGLTNKAFKGKSFVKVNFSKFTIMQHEKIADIYGISCEQEWKSGTYSDRGYLFLMIDFKDKKDSKIHVRVWQPGPFVEDGSYVGLYDFRF